MNLIVIFMTCICIVMHSLFCQLPGVELEEESPWCTSIQFSTFTILLDQILGAQWEVSSMLYLYGETPLVNYGPYSILLHLYYHQLQTLFTFHKYYFTSPQINISFHTIHLILCFQQTSEIDNLIVCWGKVVWLCYVQVPYCRWHRGSLVNHAPDYFLVPCQRQLATTFRSDFFLLLVD
jgi:hypothetical protein